jgi:hypothetical protein
MSRCECQSELTQQSPHSPGVVANEEPIVYALIDPLTFETGSVKAISKSGLKAGDVSLCRAHYCTGDLARQLIVGELQTKNPTRADHGFLYAQATEIRELKLGTSDVGAFCLIDDGMPHYAAHAHLAYSIPKDGKLRNHRETARADLLETLRKRGQFATWDGAPFKINRQAVREPSMLKAAASFVRRCIAVVIRPRSQ